MVHYVVEWLRNNRQLFSVAHGDNDLRRLTSNLINAGLHPRLTRATAAKPIKEGEFVVWEM